MSADQFPNLFTFAIGCFSLAFGLWQARREMSPRRWLAVPGRIVAAGVVEVPGGRGGSQFVPRLRYEYQCAGQTFNSERRRPSNYASGQRNYAEAVCARYGVGSQITVLVSPRDPRCSVLEYGLTPLALIPIGLGLLFGLLPLIIR